ncbi:hypothetical protein SR870_12405 [Rhodopseudomonas palustris]|uniref:hypothetical protein n=1 Tax=Rhodopseudomonas palustris TaxID=1076 RepID=UPI002ACDAE47|nr:hypothetical protein [Rhodopseudomonas palustris]WQG97523.1 hypothetical protein SR870_12405 [Rhodopseudomonas palustris]
MSPASDAQYQDFGAIEAAVRETARGRAFLASFARRVQQSDTLTLLTMLGRLEQVSQDLALRLAELEGASDPLSGHSIVATPGPRRGAALVQVGLSVPTPATVDQDADIDRARGVQANSSLEARNNATMERIDDLAVSLQSLHQQAVRLASQYDHVDAPCGPASLAIDARPVAADDTAVLPPRPSGEQDVADDEVLEQIAEALGPAR